MGVRKARGDEQIYLEVWEQGLAQGQTLPLSPGLQFQLGFSPNTTGGLVYGTHQGQVVLRVDGKLDVGHEVFHLFAGPEGGAPDHLVGDVLSHLRPHVPTCEHDDACLAWVSIVSSVHGNHVRLSADKLPYCYWQ